MDQHFELSIPFVGIYAREMKMCVHEKALCTNVPSVVLVKKEKPPGRGMRELSAVRGMFCIS